jgi:hypothetical protein
VPFIHGSTPSSFPASAEHTAAGGLACGSPGLDLGNSFGCCIGCVWVSSRRIVMLNSCISGLLLLGMVATIIILKVRQRRRRRSGTPPYPEMVQGRVPLTYSLPYGISQVSGPYFWLPYLTYNSQPDPAVLYGRDRVIRHDYETKQPQSDRLHRIV